MLKEKKSTIFLIIVAALGYFVDIYDLILFNVIKKESLIGLGMTDPVEIKNTGIMLFNWQMGGMLVGGILWGILGDKKGRLKVLFGSILMYSAANVVNAFITDIPIYAAVRFIAGIGLAGELGAGITLVAEVMSKETRGYGTMIIVTFGALGAVLAALVGAEGHVIGQLIYKLTSVELANWQVAYIIGGVLGLLLLVMRFGTVESGMFRNIEHKSVKKGDFLALFTKKRILVNYLHCILIGLPIWFIVAVLIALAEDFAKPEVLGLSEPIINGSAVMYCYLGLSFGDLLSGIFSQVFRSRKKVVIFYLLLTSVLVLVYLFTTKEASAKYFYFLCFCLGTAAGYWALFVTIAAEQFGTNIRATVTTTVPNFVRGAVVPITALFVFLEQYMGMIYSAVVVGIICIGLALYATIKVKETFGKELNYLEEM
jgi:MFS family permease